MSEPKPYIVGIAGGSASGKTSFLNELRAGMPEGSICVISQDNYYLPREMQARDVHGQINFDLPTSIHREDFVNDLKKLVAGEQVCRREYDFNNPRAEPRLVCADPAPIIVMEGLFVFHFTEIWEMLDLKVYIDARHDIKLQRRITRDAVERGYDESVVRYQWLHHVMPAYYKFLRPYRDLVDVIVTNNTHYRNGLRVLNNHLLAVLKEQTVELPAVSDSPHHA